MSDMLKTHSANCFSQVVAISNGTNLKVNTNANQNTNANTDRFKRQDKIDVAVPDGLGRHKYTNTNENPNTDRCKQM